MDDRWRWAVALLVLAAAAGGCGGGGPTTPLPAIENPKDIADSAPCELLPDDALETLGVDGEGSPSRAEEGPRCTWGEPGEQLTVTLFVDGGGLAALAENSEPTTSRVRIEGYPALETFTEGGAFCQYDVGVAPRQVLMAALEGGSPDSCTALQGLLPNLLGGLPEYLI